MCPKVSRNSKPLEFHANLLKPSFFAGISVGYNETSVTVLESAGVVQLTVDISQPDASVTFDSNIFFSLLVNTSNRMATG